MPRLIYCLFKRPWGPTEQLCQPAAPELLWKQEAESWAADSSRGNKQREEWSRATWQTSGKRNIFLSGAAREARFFSAAELRSLEDFFFLCVLVVISFFIPKKSKNFLDCCISLIIAELAWVEPEKSNFSCHDIPSPLDMEKPQRWRIGGFCLWRPRRRTAESSCLWAITMI